VLGVCRDATPTAGFCSGSHPCGHLRSTTRVRLGVGFERSSSTWFAQGGACSMAGLFASANFDRLLARRIVLVRRPAFADRRDADSPRQCALFGHARAGGALTGSDLPLTFRSSLALASPRSPAGTTASRLPRIVLSQIANSGSAATNRHAGRRIGGFTFRARDMSYHGWFRAMGLTPRNVRRRT
jgi:hypothetical protein